MRSQNWLAVGVAFLLAAAGSMAGQTEKPLIPRSAAAPVRARKKAGPELPQEGPTATLAAGLPLRVELDRRYRIRKGEAVTGRLIAPVYSGEHVVLPVNTVVDGTISELEPIAKGARTWALLDGDVTPLKQAVLTFNAVVLPNGERLRLDATATERTAPVVEMGAPQHKQSLVGKLEAQVEAKKKSVEGVVFSAHKSDVALKFVYGQLPYHPQEIWSGTQYDAVLVDAVTVPNPRYREELPLTPPRGHIPPGTLDARLTDDDQLGDGQSGSAGGGGADRALFQCGEDERGAAYRDTAAGGGDAVEAGEEIFAQRHAAICVSADGAAGRGARAHARADDSGRRNERAECFGRFRGRREGQLGTGKIYCAVAAGGDGRALLR